MMKKVLMVAAGLLVLLTGIALYGILHADPGSDEAQIRNVLEQSRLAAEGSSAKKMMTCISPNYKDTTGNTCTSIRLLANNAMKNANLAVEIKVKSLNINDNKATMEAHISIADLEGNHSIVDNDVRMKWAKEQTRKLWFFPATQWRITNAEGWQGTAGF